MPLSPPLLRVRALAGHVPLYDFDHGVMLVGRAAGRDRDGAPLADGEWVPDLGAYYRRHAAEGSLEILEELSHAEAAARGPLPVASGGAVARPADAQAIHAALMAQLYPRGGV